MPQTSNVTANLCITWWGHIIVYLVKCQSGCGCEGIYLFMNDRVSPGSPGWSRTWNSPISPSLCWNCRHGYT
jgi:hypothetical protein